MAQISFSGLYLALADDPVGSMVWFENVMDPHLTPEAETSLIELAGGRIVSRSRPTMRRQYTATIRTSQMHLAATLDAWTGRTVLIRDGLGNKLYGIYRRAPIRWHKGGAKFDWSLTLDEVTFSEAYDPEAP